LIIFFGEYSPEKQGTPNVHRFREKQAIKQNRFGNRNRANPASFKNSVDGETFT